MQAIRTSNHKIFEILSIFLVSVSFAAAQSSNNGSCPRVDKSGNGAYHIVDENCAIVSVITPAQRENAQQAQSQNWGKAGGRGNFPGNGKGGGNKDSGGGGETPPPSGPVPLVIADLAGVAEYIMDDYGLLAFESYDPTGQGATLGFLLMWNGRSLFSDADTESMGRQVSILVMNPGLVTTNPFEVQAGERIEMTHGGSGQISPASFSGHVAVSFGGNAIRLFPDTAGNLYCDPQLTLPLANSTTGCQ